MLAQSSTESFNCKLDQTTQGQLFPSRSFFSQQPESVFNSLGTTTLFDCANSAEKVSASATILARIQNARNTNHKSWHSPMRGGTFKCLQKIEKKQPQKQKSYIYAFICQG